MLKQNKIKIIISSLLTLSPILFGLIVWDKLPNSMAIHFGTSGTPNGFGTKAMAVFLIPLILFVLNLVCIFATSLDKKQKEQSKKALSIIFWIMPIISILVSASIYSVALEKAINILVIFPVLLGLLFIFLGNYMPKIKQNLTLGVRMGFTLGNEENWNKTHRFTGKLWVSVGFLTLFLVFAPINIMIIIFVALLLVATIAPVIYSYIVYKNHKKQGIAYEKPETSKIAKIITAILVPLILIFVGILMFTGNISLEYKSETFEVKATYNQSLELRYDQIDEVKYLPKDTVGARTFGFGSAKLLVGTFQNEEFGTYTRYSYTGKAPVVKVSIDDKVLIIGGKDEKETKKIYIDILSGIQGSLD